MLDLILLTADKDAQFAVRGGLQRHEALGVRPIAFDCIVHSQHDGGVRKTGPEILKLKRRVASHAILMLDYEGCGAACTPDELEAELDARLAASWGKNAKAIVIQPEIDVWMWGSDNALETLLGWNQRFKMREWLIEKQFAFRADGKPVRPKESLDAVLRQVRIPHSAALYEKIAAQVGLRRCTDPSFQRLRTHLARWFPASP